RRGGKSETIARIATYEAVHGGHARALAPGQLALIAVISPLREQSQEILGYVRGLAALPQVKRYVDGDPTRDGVRFKTSVEIRVMTADAVNLSGPTLVMLISDETAKLPGDDAVMPDREIFNSARPALAPVKGAPRRRLISITSAYIEEGIAFETDRDHFAKSDAPVLVVRGTTEQFNPNIDRAWLERERKRVGSAVFAREYQGVWQPAILEGWFGQTIEACVDKGRGTPDRQQLPVVEGRRYYAAIDAAFRGDGFTLAIAHREIPPADGKQLSRRPRTVLDGCWCWRAPKGGVLGVEKTVQQTARIIRAYNATSWADQFALDPLKEIYQRFGVYLREAPWTSQNKALKFRRVRDEMVEGLLRLPDDGELLREFHSMRGKLLKSGGEQIEARSGHDDRVHAAVIALSEAMDHEGDPEAHGDLTVVGATSGRHSSDGRVHAVIRGGGRAADKWDFGAGIRALLNDEGR
ncbi:MAG TPA: hypothetical protein VK550_22650, partial [Polyangiaceae bacterium]|nr:hypothetical protein [Polyangiaceae bacterium]